MASHSIGIWNNQWIIIIKIQGEIFHLKQANAKMLCQSFVLCQNCANICSKTSCRFLLCIYVVSLFILSTSKTAGDFAGTRRLDSPKGVKPGDDIISICHGDPNWEKYMY